MPPKKGSAVGFWTVPFLVAVLLKSVVQCQAAVNYYEAGDTAALSCGLDLTGGLTLQVLQWRKVELTTNVLVAGYLMGTTTPGNNYTGRVTISDTGFLLLTNVQQADEGTYRCKGITLSDFSQPPDVQVELQIARFTCVDNFGDTAALSCGLDLSGGLTITILQWRKVGPTTDDLVAGYAGGTTTPGPAYTGRATVNDTGFLLLTNVQQADEGTYRCTQITLSDFSSPPSQENPLRKSGPPTNVRCTTNHTTVTVKNEATLTCSFDPGCPPAQHTWVRMPTNDNINSSIGGNLFVANIIKNHTGIYECAVSNTHGSGQCQLDLTVQYPPERTSNTANLLLSIVVDQLFGSGRLKALPVDAFPPAEIVWRKNVTQDVQKRAGTGSENVVKRSNETYHDVMFGWSNAGTYTCTAENMVGSTSCGEFDVNMAVWRLALVSFFGIVILMLIAIAAILAIIYHKRSKALPKPPAEIKLQPVQSSQKVVMQWTAESEGSYNIQYRPRGRDNWTKVDVSANSHPYYKHTVDFQRNGDYEVCVLVTNAKGEKESAIKEVTVKASGHPGVADSPVSPLHGNKSDVPLVFMISEGQSYTPMKPKLDPIEIKQNPTKMKSKKKKKRKKLNEVHASDEDVKPAEE